MFRFRFDPFKSVTGNESYKMNTNKLIWNAYFPLIYLLSIFFCFSFFCKNKDILHRKESVCI